MMLARLPQFSQSWAHMDAISLHCFTHMLPAKQLTRLLNQGVLEYLAQLGFCMQPVDLMPLPPNSTERMPVVCNGRSGILILRTQRVLAGGGEMSASRFETVCGKGDAKKWKCSISTEIQPGVPGEVGLDCKSLLDPAWWCQKACMQLSRLP